MSAEAGATKPLSRARVLVTRSHEQASALCSRLEALGAWVSAVPVIAIGEPDDWSNVDAALNSLDDFDWVIFASSNAARFFVERCRALGLLSRLKRVAVAAVGPSTASALAQQEIVTKFVPSKSIAEQFVIEFPQHTKLAGKKILWPRGNLGRTLIADALAEEGATVCAVECYRSLPPIEQYATAQQLAQLLQGQQLTHVLLASGQSAKSFAMLATAGLSGRALADAIEYETGQLAVLAEYLRHVLIVSIGPETSKACREFMGRVDIEAEIHTIDGLIAALIAAEI